MQYMGSKNRIAKELIPIITKDLKSDQYYVEPFVGGCNMIDKVKHNLRLGADNNQYLIALLKAGQQLIELPEEITREQHTQIKNNKSDYPEWYVGFVGFLCSFRGIFFSGFAPNNVLKATGKYQDYQKQQINSFRKQSILLKDIDLRCTNYDTLEIPNNSIIYCDPPYANTTKYSKDSFDSIRFWRWCRDKVTEGHKVYVSEYNAPDDFVCIWEKEISSNLGSSSKTATEKLFVHKTQL